MSTVVPPSSTTSDRVSDDKEASSVVDDHKQIPLYNPHVDVSGVNEKKLMRRIDIALIPWLSLLYLLSFLDRTSIGKYVITSISVAVTHKLGIGYEIVQRYVSTFRKTPLPHEVRQLYNMEKDLNMSDNQYLLTLTVISYSTLLTA